MATVKPLVATAVGDWQFEVNGLFMGIDTPYMVQKVTGLKDQAPRGSYPNRPLSHGSMPVPDYLSQKQIMVDLTIPNPEVADDLSAALLRRIDWTLIPNPGVAYTGNAYYRVDERGLVELKGVVTLTSAGPVVLPLPAPAHSLPMNDPTYFDWTGVPTDRNTYASGGALSMGNYNGSGFVLDLANIAWQGTPPAVPLPVDYRLEFLLDKLHEAWAPVLDGVTLQQFAFTLPGQVKKMFWGRARNISVDMEHYEDGWVDATVEFIATDPITYAFQESSANVTLGEMGVGRAYPRTYPMAYGATTSSIANVQNNGNAPTSPIVTFYGPITNPAAEHATTGQRVSFNIVLADGDTLVVDFAARTVVLNGTVSRYNTLSSANDQWWELAPGPNPIRYAASAYVGGSLMNVRWRSAWF